MKQILIGTTNPAKFNDYKEMLKDFPLEVVSLYNFKVQPPDESGKDFEENAILKARYYFQKTGIPTLADSGGFEIDALEGAPGLKRKKWLGKESSDEELIERVYKEMKKTKAESRSCRLKIVVAVATPFGLVTSEGVAEGVVSDKPSAKKVKGEPFKSVIYFPNYHKYFSELSKQEQEIMNHRRAAVDKIKDIFKELST
jgi:XTP/dITP diphosphohydrolase